jgi:uncharacterized membrane protein
LGYANYYLYLVASIMEIVFFCVKQNSNRVNALTYVPPKWFSFKFLLTPWLKLITLGTMVMVSGDEFSGGESVY